MKTAVLDYERNSLDTFDLLDELTQLGDFIGRAESRRVDVNDFNHCLLEREVDEFASTISEAINDFVDAVRMHRIKVLSELERRDSSRV